VKFQTHIAAAESTPAEPWRVRLNTQDASRYDYWKRMEFTESEWCGLKQHAVERGLDFLSSPFSIEAFELLHRVGVAAWKVASGEMSNPLLLERMTQTGLPILLSSGLSGLAELDAAVATVRRVGNPLGLLQCTSAYPCPPEKCGLNLIPFFGERYGCTVGLSDHSGTIFPGLAAVTLGIGVLEVHVTLSREMFGPDVPASVTTAELRELVTGVRYIERLMASPINKDATAHETLALRRLFTKNIVARTELFAGTLLREEHLALKKAGTGLAPARLPDLLGARLRRDVHADEPLLEADIE